MNGSKPELMVSGVGGRRSFSGGDGWEGMKKDYKAADPFSGGSD